MYKLKKRKTANFIDFEIIDNDSDNDNENDDNENDDNDNDFITSR